VPHGVTLRQQHFTGTTSIDNSSFISRMSACSSVSPASMVPPGKQSLPGAVTHWLRRMVNNLSPRSMTPTTPRFPFTNGFGRFMVAELPWCRLASKMSRM
jgi:hypothetical protein